MAPIPVWLPDSKANRIFLILGLGLGLISLIFTQVYQWIFNNDILFNAPVSSWIIMEITWCILIYILYLRSLPRTWLPSQKPTLGSPRFIASYKTRAFLYAVLALSLLGLFFLYVNRVAGPYPGIPLMETEWILILIISGFGIAFTLSYTKEIRKYKTMIESDESPEYENATYES